MPNTISALPASSYKLTHDPTVTLQGDPMGVLGSNPFAEMTEDILFGVVNEFLTIVDDATGLDLLGMITPLEHLLGGGDGTNLLSGFVGFIANLANIGTDVNAVIHIVENLPLDVAHLIGTLDPGLFGGVPIGSLTNAQPNLFKAPIFSADALLPSPDWSVDTSSSRSDDGSGSLLVTADGRPMAIRSGESPTDRIFASAGQTFSTAIYVSNVDYQGTGINTPAVLLQIVPFIGDVIQEFVTIDSYAPTADVAWPGNLMSGNYVVPAGITSIQVRILITADALAGQFRFDDGSIKQVGQIQKGWVAGLEDDLQFVDDRFHALVDGVASAARGIPVIGVEIDDAIEALSNFLPRNIGGSLGSGSLPGDLQGIIDHLVGGMKNKQVSGASLADLYNAINAAINNSPGSDVTTFYDTTITVPIETWVQQMDVILVGEGQSGENGETLGLFGQGGQAGKVNIATWIRGTHFDNSVTSMTLTINSDGSITAAIPGHSFSAVKGSGSQSPHFGTGFMGIGPGNIPYNGKNYAGGGNQNAAGAAGLGPGGGGGGGNGLLFGAGGKGGPAGGWVRKLGTVLVGGDTGADTTAPSAPTPHFISATNSTVTISATGSVDA